jgi:fatty-acyl-CoA synthase
MPTKSPYGNYAYAILTGSALRTPDKVALVCRGQSFTFDQLNRRVNKVANALLAAGVTAGMRVGSLLSGSMEIADLYLAEGKIGAVIAAFNPYWPEDQIVATCELSELHAFVFDKANAAVAAKVCARVPSIKLFLSVDGDLVPLIESAPEVEPVPGAHGDDPFALFYTSGTTGVSKATIHTHAGVKNTGDFLLELPHEDHHVWGTGPIIWGVGFPCTLGAALGVGMKTALEDDFGPRPFLEAVQRERISHVIMLPSQWADLLANHPHEQYDLSSLKVIILGAEPLGAALLAKVRKRLPDVGLYAFYGQTEQPYTCIQRLSDDATEPEVVGPARTGCAVKILDPQGNRVIGQVGDLAITGPQRMAGYYNQPAKNAESIRDGWFYTGDLGLVDAKGRLHVLGRKEDAISRGGRYIRPLEIEDVLMTVPGVGEAGVIGAPDGAVEQKIILAVAPETGHSLTEDGLWQAVREKLPENLWPDLIVVDSELPHTNDNSGGRGKLMRRGIRDRYEGRL